jgi:hypothetical protein
VHENDPDYIAEIESFGWYPLVETEEEALETFNAKLQCKLKDN